MDNERTDISRMPYYRDTTQKVLPLVYDDALSYLESMSKVVTKLNQVIDKCNNLTDESVKIANAYTDSKIAGLNQAVLDALDELRSVETSLNALYQTFIKNVNSQLMLFDGRLSDLDKEIIASVLSVNARTDLAIKQNNEYILEELSKNLADVYVTNFFTGERISVQDMFYYMANLHVANGITYTELANKNVTYDYLNSLNMTYTELVLKGGIII